VNADLMMSGGKIVGSVVLLGLVLWAVSRLSRIAKLDPEIGRKLVHISLGLYCLAFPWIFLAAWEVAVTCALAVGLFMLARGTMRASLGGGLHGVERTSYGELLFAAAVALLFWLKDGHYILARHDVPPIGPVLYVLPILILTLCDAASAIVGSRYGRRVFQIEEGKKSVEGVVVFAVTAWLVSLIAFLLLTDIDREEAVLLAFITAVFGALLEAASWRGLDNLFIPLGLYFLLANLLHLGVIGLAEVAGIFFLALIGLLYMARRSGADRHFLAIGFTLFFCIDIFSGFLSMMTPALAVAAYFGTIRLRKIETPPFDALSLLLTIFTVSLCFFLVSNLGALDTIFSFNLAFAALAAGIVMRFGMSRGTSQVTSRVTGMVMAIGTVMVTWMVMSIRTVWLQGASLPAWLFAGVGLGGILLVTAAGWVIARTPSRRPWIVLGGLSMAVGLVALPFSPSLHPSLSPSSFPASFPA
jgi:dolichol kinase